MELVVDANILVAGLLKTALTRELLLDERLVLYAPEYSLSEAERVLASPRIRRKLGGLSASDMQRLIDDLTRKIRVFPAKAYESQLARARQLAPDPADTPYLALALHLHVPLWSNDSALKEQRSIPIYTTQELLELL